MPFQWQAFKVYEQSLTQIRSVYHCLLSMHDIIGSGFSEMLYNDVIRPLSACLAGLVAPIVVSAQRIEENVEAKSDKEFQIQDIGLVSITQALVTLDDQYFLLRKHMISQKSLSQLLPPLRPFFNFLYIVREFVKQWVILENTLITTFGLGELIPAISDEFPESDAGDVFAQASTPESQDSLKTSMLHISHREEEVSVSIQDELETPVDDIEADSNEE